MKNKLNFNKIVEMNIIKDRSKKDKYSFFTIPTNITDINTNKAQILYLTINPYDIKQVSEVIKLDNNFVFYYITNVDDNKIREACFPIEIGNELKAFNEAIKIKNWIADAIVKKYNNKELIS